MLLPPSTNGDYRGHPPEQAASVIAVALAGIPLYFAQPRRT